MQKFNILLNSRPQKANRKKWQIEKMAQLRNFHF